MWKEKRKHNMALTQAAGYVPTNEEADMYSARMTMIKAAYALWVKNNPEAAAAQTTDLKARVEEARAVYEAACQAPELLAAQSALDRAMLAENKAPGDRKIAEEVRVTWRALYEVSKPMKAAKEALWAAECAAKEGDNDAYLERWWNNTSV